MGYTHDYVEFVVHKVALGQGLIEVRHFLPVNVIPLMFHTQIPLIYCLRYEGQQLVATSYKTLHTKSLSLYLKMKSFKPVREIYKKKLKMGRHKQPQQPNFKDSMHNMFHTCPLNYSTQQTSTPHNSVIPTLLRNTVISTQNITTLTTAIPKIYFLYIIKLYP